MAIKNVTVSDSEDLHHFEGGSLYWQLDEHDVLHVIDIENEQEPKQLATFRHWVSIKDSSDE